MSDFEDAIGDMTTDLLTEAGVSCVYHRGTTSTTMTLRKSVQPPFQVEGSNGAIVEVRPVDFIALSSALPYVVPEIGDRISTGGQVFELFAEAGSKCWRQISAQMTRLHTKRVK